jgi:hypothetical protein
LHAEPKTKRKEVTRRMDHDALASLEAAPDDELFIAALVTE